MRIAICDDREDDRGALKALLEAYGQDFTAPAETTQREPPLWIYPYVAVCRQYIYPM